MTYSDGIQFFAHMLDEAMFDKADGSGVTIDVSGKADFERFCDAVGELVSASVGKMDVVDGDVDDTLSNGSEFSLGFERANAGRWYRGFGGSWQEPPEPAGVYDWDVEPLRELDPEAKAVFADAGLDVIWPDEEKIATEAGADATGRRDRGMGGRSQPKTRISYTVPVRFRVADAGRLAAFLAKASR